VSPLHQPDPFVPSAVVSLAGIGDLKAFARFVPLLCGPGIIERLTNTPSAGSGGAYEEVSPAALPAPEAHVVMISGVLDRLVPPYVAYDYARAMRARGGAPPELLDIPAAGHFDLVTPGAPAWAEVSSRIEAALGRARQTSE
jgi:hypothetical protein